MPPGGSRKGKPNKLTAALKSMILEALDGVGGVQYLMRQAEANPAPFMALLGKVLPMTVMGTGNPDDAIVLDVREGARQRAEELMQKLICIEAERGDGA